MSKKIVGIYKITSPTGRVYVGQSIDVKKRLYSYRKLKCKTQTLLYRSLLKYGFSNHSVEIIKECEPDKLNIYERYYQELYDCLTNGLNCVLQETEVKKKVISESTRVKMSKAQLGEKHPMWGRRGVLSPHFGVKQKPEQIEKLRAKRKGKKYSAESNAKKGSKGVNNPFYGRSHSPEQLRKYVVSQSNKVKVVHGDKEIIFECVQDCADYFNCTSKNVLFRDKRRRQGINSSFGMFKGVYLEILSS